MSGLADQLVVTLARQVRDGDVVGVGLGTPLALCACLVARRTHAPRADLLVAGAVSPDAGLLECMRGAGALAGRTAGFVPHLDTMDMAERQAMTLQFLRPAQIDGEGSVNTSRVAGPDGRAMRFPGGLAMADVPRLMPRVVLYHTDHRPRALPARVEVVTGRGGPSMRGPYRSEGSILAITDLGVIAFGRRSRLVSAHPGVSAWEVAAATGFALAVDERVPVTPAPTPDELAAIEEVDPHALREVEIRATRADAAARMARLVEGEPRSPRSPTR